MWSVLVRVFRTAWCHVIFGCDLVVWPGWHPMADVSVLLVALPRCSSCKTTCKISAPLWAKLISWCWCGYHIALFQLADTLQVLLLSHWLHFCCPGWRHLMQLGITGDIRMLRLALVGTNQPTGMFPLGLVLLFAACPLWGLTFQAKALCSTLCKVLFIGCVHATLFSLLLFTFFHLPPGFILALGKACLQIDVKLMKILCPGCRPSPLVLASAAINAFLHLFQPLPSLSWQLNWKPTAILLSLYFAWGTNNRLKLTQIMILIGLIFAIGFRKKSYFSPSSSLVNVINPSMVLKTSKIFSTEK